MKGYWIEIIDRKLPKDIEPGRYLITRKNNSSGQRTIHVSTFRRNVGWDYISSQKSYPVAIWSETLPEPYKLNTQAELEVESLKGRIRELEDQIEKLKGEI